MKKTTSPLQYNDKKNKKFKQNEIVYVRILLYIMLLFTVIFLSVIPPFYTIKNTEDNGVVEIIDGSLKHKLKSKQDITSSKKSHVSQNDNKAIQYTKNNTEHSETIVISDDDDSDLALTKEEKENLGCIIQNANSTCYIISFLQLLFTGIKFIGFDTFFKQLEKATDILEGNNTGDEKNTIWMDEFNKENIRRRDLLNELKKTYLIYQKHQSSEILNLDLTNIISLLELGSKSKITSVDSESIDLDDPLFALRRLMGIFSCTKQKLDMEKITVTNNRLYSDSLHIPFIHSIDQTLTVTAAMSHSNTLLHNTTLLGGEHHNPIFKSESNITILKDNHINLNDLSAEIVSSSNGDHDTFSYVYPNNSTKLLGMFHFCSYRNVLDSEMFVGGKHDRDLYQKKFTSTSDPIVNPRDIYSGLTSTSLKSLLKKTEDDSTITLLGWCEGNNSHFTANIILSDTKFAKYNLSSMNTCKIHHLKNNETDIVRPIIVLYGIKVA
jgi:hypothetical protein